MTQHRLPKGPPPKKTHRYHDVPPHFACTAPDLLLWRTFCAGFRHSAGFHARVVLDSVAFRLGVLGEVDDVQGILGVDRVLPDVVRVLVSW